MLKTQTFAIISEDKIVGFFANYICLPFEGDESLLFPLDGADGSPGGFVVGWLVG